jgi:PAS domain S-box-containing protein
VRALQCGAKDFVSKPFDLVEVKTRIHNMLEVRLLYKKLKDYNGLLERTVQQRTAELRESEERYRCLTELACDWYWEQDESGNFTKVGGPVLEMLGSSVSDVSSKQADASDHWDEIARVELKSRIAARQPFLDFILARVKSDGTQQRYQISGQPMFDCSCGYIGYRGIGVELTPVPPSRPHVLSS